MKRATIAWLCCAGALASLCILVVMHDRDIARHEQAVQRLVNEHIEPMKEQIMRLDGRAGERWRRDE